jgi:eukaryotic-like serine/threonine-protein kinase
MTEPRRLGDRYELGEVLGRGGMAEVRRGRDLRLGRTVAIKMLRVDHASDSTFQARFRREAQSAASLNHRPIVAVYDTGEDYIDGHRIPYIVMEYVEGHTLRELLRERARFTPERAIEVTAGILDALEYSHRAGIVHRDIKPGNVMITESGEVKVMDFGIARSLAETGAALTQTAAVVGTAQYISPEQARGEAADARSDLYATGCVLYELLTGRPPFVGESLVSVAVSHVREMPTPPSALDPSIPRDLDAIALKALAKDRLDRYQSAYEMHADLERCAAGLPVAAAADATAATQFIGGGYADTMYDQTPTSLEELEDYGEEEEPERRGMSWGALVAAALAILIVAGIIGYLIFNRPAEPDVVRVPSVVGDTFEEASATLTGLDLVPEREDRVTEDEDEVGLVLEQNPGPNIDVEVGSTVTLFVGVPPDQVAVPDGLVGMQRAEAEQAIRDADLRVGDVTLNTESDEEPGTVLSTDPASGELVDPGTEVDLVVAAAPETTTVPNLQGLTQQEAQQTLEGANLQLGTVTSRPDSAPEDTVIESSPGRGETVQVGARVDIVLSEGEETENVPQVTGLPENAARNILDQLGFEVDTQQQETCDVPPDIVTDQDPSQGTSRPVGSTVTIVVSEEPPGGCEDNGNDND